MMLQPIVRAAGSARCEPPGDARDSAPDASAGKQATGSTDSVDWHLEGIAEGAL